MSKHDHVLVVLILILWLTVAMLLVCICRAAADADTPAPTSTNRGSYTNAENRMLPEDPLDKAFALAGLRAGRRLRVRADR